MARSISKGPKPKGGYATPSRQSLADAKARALARQNKKSEAPAKAAAYKPREERKSIYGDAAITVQAALLRAQKQGIAKVDARMLLLHALGQDSLNAAWLVAHDHDDLTAPLAVAYSALCTRRRAGEPVAYIIGFKEFYGLRLAVDKRVLDPRDDTETLADWALQIMKIFPPEPKRGLGHASTSTSASRSVPSSVRPELVEGKQKALDLGTGSGAIALALQSKCPAWQIHATDASANALAVARANAQTHQLSVQFHQGNWLGAVTGEKFQLIISNPPYIAAADPHLAALSHEPLQALASGPDGLEDIRQIIGQAPAHLQAGGWLLLEHGYDQAEAVRSLLQTTGFVQVESRKDLAGVERCSGGKLA